MGVTENWVSSPFPEFHTSSSAVSLCPTGSIHFTENLHFFHSPGSKGKKKRTIKVTEEGDDQFSAEQGMFPFDLEIIYSHFQKICLLTVKFK
jgi:hypothetical protein